MVQHVDVAVLTLLDDKLLPVQLARQTAHRDIFEPCQHVVFGINLCKEKGDEMRIQPIYLKMQDGVFRSFAIKVLIPDWKYFTASKGPAFKPLLK